MSQPSEKDVVPEEEPSFWDQLDDGVDEPAVEPADWSGDELEQAYRRAIEALEASEAELPDNAQTTASDDAAVSNPAENQSTSQIVSASISDVPVITDAEREEASSALKQLADQRAVASSEQPQTVRPRQILEACLFVGGDALTAKKLSSVLRGEFSVEYIERELDELNSLYSSERRPYEVRLGDGGYRLALRDDFERIRSKAYGLGPKEVRLSQEALEVLALVAYRQPISAPAIEDLGKPGCGAILRQLLRRELIAVDRNPENPRDVRYKTTSRFLSLFGIRSLDELPRHEQVNYK